jgi:uncharacterized repeat protein (TIGR01451 family)
VVWTKPLVSDYWEWGDIYLTVYISDTASLDDVLTNTVRISTSDEEYEYNNNEYTLYLALGPELGVSKWKYSGEAIPGWYIVYRIEYHNEGDGAAHNVRITDTLPTLVNYFSHSSSGGFTAVITGNTVVWTNPSLPSGSLGSLDIMVLIPGTVPYGGKLVNEVQISSSDEESDYSDNSDIDIQTLPGGLYLPLILKE